MSASFGLFHLPFSSLALLQVLAIGRRISYLSLDMYALHLLLSIG
jgi:hypothetical protein